MKLINKNIIKYFHMIPLWKSPIKLPVELPVAIDPAVELLLLKLCSQLLPRLCRRTRCKTKQ